MSDELHEHMEAVVKRYSKTLFRLPSKAKLMAYMLLGSLASGLCSSAWLLAFGAPAWAYLASSILLPLAALASWALDSTILAGDPVLNPRRCLGLELFSLAALGPPSAIGGLLATFLGSGPSLVLRLASVGASISISARALTLASASLASRGRSAVSTAVKPALWLLAVYASTLLSPQSPLVSAQDALFVGLTLAVGSLAAGAFLASVRRIGFRLFGVSSFRLIRAFTVSWTEDYNELLESFLDEIGAEATVRAQVLLFEDEEGQPIGALVVPGVHPGPFRWIGSSPLPSLIQEALEERLGCPVAVPHGLSGHELNLTSRGQCEKLISAILASLSTLKGPYGEASAFSRANSGVAKASCQLLGPVALMTLTAAPETMEDLPPELGELVARRARSMGLEDALVIDAHNCVDGPLRRSDVVKRFSQAALRALEEALRAPKGPFRAGMAKVVPTEFSLDEGMGPGGVVALALEVGGARWAYVVIDGNNMIRGLRERLLAEVEALGFSGGEVMTTDTHVVNARVLVERGYHPVGEVMDWDLLAKHVRAALEGALRALRPARVRWGAAEAKVKVFGAEQLKRLCELPLNSIRAVRNMAAGILGPVHALLLALAFLL